MKKYVCIHGHYYQPPRENAWLEVVEYQESAHPFHDWNERINAECYAPNAASRILDSSGLIKKITNNYARINFNMGPTLLSWLEVADPDTYQAILDADKESQAYFSGHGSAIAQVHGHLIMPLANKRDKITQVVWGIKDFEHRFKRKPEGIWLAETAVDTPTLEVLADHGIQYTILAPRQAKAFRKIGDTEWTGTPNVSVDPRYPYLYKLPSGKTISLFFYDGRIAQDVAFNRLLNSGKQFANRLIGTLDDDADAPQLAHIATDGESYGHHHKKGEMALADCINYIEKQSNAKITNYGEFLDIAPPQYEIQIHENSSWSCVHGVERWRSNCGCHTGGQYGWTQAWRKPLRDALDWLRDELIMIYEQQADTVMLDPWKARDEFIDVLLDRGEESVNRFIERHSKHAPTEKNKVHILRLLEMQRNAMLMYTSCGWFFSEVSGIETTQILQYACRTIYYAKQVDGTDLHNEFVRRLAEVPSNMAEHKNGADIYRKHVLPIQVGLERTGMHYAVSSLFEKHPETLSIFNYEAKSEQFYRFKAGRQKIAIGRTVVKSRVTHSKKRFSFAVLYLGQQHIIGHISLDMTESQFNEALNHLKKAFNSSNIGEVIRLLQYHFGVQKYSINNLFKDEKIKILNQLLADNLKNTETSLRDIYNDNYHLMNTLRQDNLLVTGQFKEIVQFVLNSDLRHYFNPEELFVKELRRIKEEFEKWNVQIQDINAIQLLANESMLKALERLEQNPHELDRLQKMNEILKLLSALGLKLEGWKSQNQYFSIATNQAFLEEVAHNTTWLDLFQKIGTHLGVGVNFEYLMEKV